ncbi:MAG: xanthine dehydrogenase family protein molybdopterin-binding subunit, partial [Chryseobacterium sp.]
FGSGLRPQYQLYLSAMAALALKRNVRVVLDRSQMFTFGHRPQTHQHLRFAAGLDGKITAMQHATVAETSRFEDYTETVSNWSHRIYPADNTLLTYQLVPLDVYTPIDMRSPGGSTAFATIECTIDELAYKLGMDPMEFRLLNYAEVDPSNGKPFTSKALRECYLEGAERFGWKNRNPEPRSMTRGNKWVGYGLAAGMWDANQFPARMEARINADGHLEIENAVTDIGTGTFTVITQIAADEIGLTIDKVSFLYGDSKRPFSMIQGGSTMTASTGAAVVASVRALKEKILKAVKRMDVPAMKDVTLDAVDFKDGSIYLKGQPHISVSFKEIVAARKGKVIKTTNMATPQMLKLRKYSRAAHGVSFVEVEVDKELREITVTRALTAIAAGTIINPKTARSQIEGSMVWGISKALQEESLLDEHLGKFMNHNLAEYHVPVHADVNELDVIFVDERDDIINELGIKGVGEIGLVSMPAAVANAIYHATGKRVNKLPIHLEDLL